MRKQLIATTLLVSAFSLTKAMALDLSINETLQTARQNTINTYVMNLQQADNKAMMELFEKNGYVISTSRGKVDAKEFFDGFLPEITSARTEIHQVFTAGNDKMAARFHFTFKMKNGEAGDGEYVDEFTFMPGTDKLESAFMFENLTGAF